MSGLIYNISALLTSISTLNVGIFNLSVKVSFYFVVQWWSESSSMVSMLSIWIKNANFYFYFLKLIKSWVKSVKALHCFCALTVAECRLFPTCRTDSALKFGWFFLYILSCSTWYALIHYLFVCFFSWLPTTYLIVLIFNELREADPYWVLYYCGYSSSNCPSRKITDVSSFFYFAFCFLWV